MLGSIRFSLASFGVTAALALSCAPSASAQGDSTQGDRTRSDSAQVDEEEFDRTPRRCLSTARIRQTDILDDRTILFYLRGNREVFRTYLPRECPGLERNDRFSYHTTNGQLCDVDTITVLEQFGAGLSPSFTCRLGDFIPITREEAEDLKLESEGEALKRKAIRSAPAELPPEDAAEAPAEQADGAPPGSADSSAPAEEPSRRSRRRGSGTAER
jgi:hypothetical protein